MKQRPVIIIGAGGHAKVIYDILMLTGVEVLGFSDLDSARTGHNIHGRPIVGDDTAVLRNTPESVLLVNGIGSIGDLQGRIAVFDKYTRKGYGFMTVIHPSAVVSPGSTIGIGVQIMAGAVVQIDSRIANNCIVNTGAILEHDCRIDDHVHLAPGVTLSGDVIVGSGSHIGTGATVVQGIRIGSRCTVAAGAVVLSDVGDGKKVGGVPAKELSI